jgi:hypothetical protein
MPASAPVVEPQSSNPGTPAREPEPLIVESAGILAPGAADGAGEPLGEGSDETTNPFESDPTPQLPLF